MPEISVIIPAYNSAHFLKDALDSVLAQTFRDLEVLVIDDGSTDNTRELVSSYGGQLRYFYQQNSGVALARNRGIEESRARYIAFLDADDLWMPEKLERQFEALENGSEYRACYTNFTTVASDLTPLEGNSSSRKSSGLADLLLRGNVVGTPSTVFCERLLLEATGGFDPSLSQCADWDMWMRMTALTEFFYFEEPMVAYRQHGNNMSRDVALLERDSLRVLEKGFALPALSQDLRRRRRAAFARNYMVLAGSYFHAKSYGNFARCASRALRLDFRQAGYLMAFPARALTRSKSYLHAEIS